MENEKDSDYRAVEEARKEAEIAAQRLSLALETLNAGVFETDYKSRTFWCSPQFISVVGAELKFEDVQAGWSVLYEEDAHFVAERLLEAIETRSTALMEFRIRLPSGELRWIDSRADVQFNAAGELERIVGIVIDIDARKRQELALVEAEKAAQAASEAKSQFLANMSHEIRTPMNGVLGVLHLLSNEPLSSAGRQLLNDAQECGRMLSQLLDDVVDFSKVEAGRLELSPEPLSPRDTLESVVRLLRPRARAKGLKLETRFEGHDQCILADAARLRQALFNLIGNGVKFTNEGQVEARLGITDLDGRSSRIRFEIEDTGIGIPEALQPGLFQRFHQADGSMSRRFGGAGLGLVISRTLAQLMQGDVGFTSEEGRGSTFWLEIVAPNAPKKSAEVVEPEVLPPLRVLVVEDNRTNQVVISKILESLGMSVAIAEDGLDGVEAVQAQSYDLVLMDIQMPRLDGVGATRMIRDLSGPAAHVPIIGLTANALNHQRQAYLAAGMDGVVAKPIAPAALVGEIARVLAAEGEGESLKLAQS